MKEARQHTRKHRNKRKGIRWEKDCSTGAVASIITLCLPNTRMEAGITPYTSLNEEQSLCKWDTVADLPSPWVGRAWPLGTPPWGSPQVLWEGSQVEMTLMCPRLMGHRSQLCCRASVMDRKPQVCVGGVLGVKLAQTVTAIYLKAKPVATDRCLGTNHLVSGAMIWCWWANDLVSGDQWFGVGWLLI